MKEEDTLVQKAQQGNKEAFGTLYDRYVLKIYRFVYLKVSDKSEAEDITQQVFIRAWENIGSFTFQGFPFSSWLYRIASNAVIDSYRTKKSTVSIELVSESEISYIARGEEVLDIKREIFQVMNALKELKPDEQSILVMRFVDELSNKEVAHALGKTEGSVRVIQHRALKQLKKKLDINYNE
jgi:RNA polymerase sigma-70 factor (ECF subfamily)